MIVTLFDRINLKNFVIVKDFEMKTTTWFFVMETWFLEKPAYMESRRTQNN